MTAASAITVSRIAPETRIVVRLLTLTDCSRQVREVGRIRANRSVVGGRGSLTAPVVAEGFQCFGLMAQGLRPKG